MSEGWYSIDNIDEVDSPALIIYNQRVEQNIQSAISMVTNVDRLRPHVKTHKCAEVTNMLLDAGITKFKCATIAEAEMLAICGAADVLLAYQPQGPKIERLLQLILNYPDTFFSCLVDNIHTANYINEKAKLASLRVGVYVDLNVGMNRTGIEPGAEVFELCLELQKLDSINFLGLHAYDGHIRNPDVEVRTRDCHEAFQPVLELRNNLIASGLTELKTIAGGSPTFPIHAKRDDVECSPGTFVFWDEGYLTNCPEQPFVPAALLISRVVSRPAKNIVCLDVGHKSVAAENLIEKRITFLNKPDLTVKGQSEEHLIAGCGDWSTIKEGDIFYGLPYHICPTVALYDEAFIVKDKRVVGKWKIVARDRKIQY